MIFGPTPLDEADGAVLAHTHRLPGRVLKKGSVLDAAALEALRAAGLDPVIAARLEPGDVAEDAAAQRIAAALLGPGSVNGLQMSRAATGRVNLVAQAAGLLQVDRARIDALNAVDEAVTVATLPDATPVAAGEMVATIKIIPFAVPGAVLAHAEAACAGGAMAVLPWQARRVGLVLTTLPGLKPSIIEGTIEATAGRVARHRRHSAAAPAMPAPDGADRSRAARVAGGRRGPAAGRGRVGRGGPAGCGAGRDRRGRGRDPAFRHAGRPGQPHLPRPDRRRCRRWCCPVAHGARSRTGSTWCCTGWPPGCR